MMPRQTMGLTFPRTDAAETMGIQRDEKHHPIAPLAA
ncbi:MAG: hypothetical protein QOD74_354, partial [Variibacter sp.]|nr:hypothetical protein [Variibacter sp.]